MATQAPDTAAAPNIHDARDTLLALAANDEEERAAKEAVVVLAHSIAHSLERLAFVAEAQFERDSFRG